MVNAKAYAIALSAVRSGGVEPTMPGWMAANEYAAAAVVGREYTGSKADVAAQRMNEAIALRQEYLNG